jgi:hypothetical protein
MLWHIFLFLRLRLAENLLPVKESYRYFFRGGFVDLLAMVRFPLRLARCSRNFASIS